MGDATTGECLSSAKVIICCSIYLLQKVARLEVFYVEFGVGWDVSFVSHDVVFDIGVFGDEFDSELSWCVDVDSRWYRKWCWALEEEARLCDERGVCYDVVWYVGCVVECDFPLCVGLCVGDVFDALFECDDVFDGSLVIWYTETIRLPIENIRRMWIKAKIIYDILEVVVGCDGDGCTGEYDGIDEIHQSEYRSDLYCFDEVFECVAAVEVCLVELFFLEEKDIRHVECSLDVVVIFVFVREVGLLVEFFCSFTFCYSCCLDVSFF